MWRAVVHIFYRVNNFKTNARPLGSFVEESFNNGHRINFPIKKEEIFYGFKMLPRVQ